MEVLTGRRSRIYTLRRQPSFPTSPERSPKLDSVRKVTKLCPLGIPLGIPLVPSFEPSIVVSVKDIRLDRTCNRHEFRSQLIRSGRWSFRFCKAQGVGSSRVRREQLALVHHGPPELRKKTVTSQRSVYDAFGAGHSSTSISAKLRQLAASDC